MAYNPRSYKPTFLDRLVWGTLAIGTLICGPAIVLYKIANAAQVTP